MWKNAIPYRSNYRKSTGERRPPEPRVALPEILMMGAFTLNRLKFSSVRFNLHLKEIIGKSLYHNGLLEFHFGDIHSAVDRDIDGPRGWGRPEVDPPG